MKTSHSLLSSFIGGGPIPDPLEGLQDQVVTLPGHEAGDGEQDELSFQPELSPHGLHEAFPLRGQEEFARADPVGNDPDPAPVDTAPEETRGGVAADRKDP